MDILEVLNTLRVPGYENNLPAGGPPRQPRLPVGPALTVGDIRAQGAIDDAAGSMQPDIHAFTEEAPEDPAGAFLGGRERLRGQRAKLEAARSREQDALENRRYLGQDTVEGLQRKFAGTTPGSPEWFARMTGEDSSTTIEPGAGVTAQAPKPTGALSYEDTELRRGVPPAPAPQGALDAARNPEGIGETMGDPRRLSDQQHLDVLKAQLTDPHRDMSFDSELQREIAMVERRLAGGAAPKASTAGMKVIGPQGALGAEAIDTDPYEGLVAGSAQQGIESSVRGALAQEDSAAAPPARRASLADRYAKRVGEIPAAGDGSLSPDQKSQAQLDFFLSLLANNKPGSRFLQNAGASGLAVSGQVRDTREKNKRDASGRRRDAMDEAFKEVSFADRDEDNQTGRERVELLKKQLEQGKFKVEKSADGLVLIDGNTGTSKVIKGEDGKPLMPKSDNPNIDFYKWLLDDPKRAEFFMQSKSRDKNDTDQIVDAATKLLSTDLTGRLTPEDALMRARQIVLGAKGQGAPAGNQKPDPVANKGRTISGPDGRFKSDGKTWVKIQ
jgi:anti-sigma28 factor (negative regulator of flagellin synthesis)